MWCDARAPSLRTERPAISPLFPYTTLFRSSLEASCPADKLKALQDTNPNFYTIAYINCSAAVKALSDVICTSGNAVKRSEEHTSELQSRLHLVCRLLLEKKNSSVAC